MSATAKNLEAISNAIKQHNSRCEGSIVEIQMNPFEVDRLGWDDLQGIPIIGNPELGTGSFRLLCDAEKSGVGKAEAETEQLTPIEQPVFAASRAL